MVALSDQLGDDCERLSGGSADPALLPLGREEEREEKAEGRVRVRGYGREALRSIFGGVVVGAGENWSCGGEVVFSGTSRRRLLVLAARSRVCDKRCLFLGVAAMALKRGPAGDVWCWWTDTTGPSRLMLGMDRSAVSFPAQDRARTTLPARIERERGVSYFVPCTYGACNGFIGAATVRGPRARSELVNSYAAKKLNWRGSYLR